MLVTSPRPELKAIGKGTCVLAVGEQWTLYPNTAIAKQETLRVRAAGITSEKIMVRLSVSSKGSWKLEMIDIQHSHRTISVGDGWEVISSIELTGS
jgi:hypothetical protein